MLSCPVVVVGWGSESGNVALRVRYEGSCLTQACLSQAHCKLIITSILLSLIIQEIIMMRTQ